MQTGGLSATNACRVTTRSNVARDAHHEARRNAHLFARAASVLHFEVVLIDRGPRWEWRLSDALGRIIMQGSERARTEARYMAERALFLLLLTTARNSA